jgi:hypothetical protein
VNCSPHRWLPISTFPTSIRPAFWPDVLTPQILDDCNNVASVNKQRGGQVPG